MMGLKSDTLRRLYPRVARVYDELYLMCRRTQFIHVEIEKKGGKVDHKFAEYTTGYAFLPDTGGVLDQSVWIMALFDHFRQGDAAAFSRQLKA